MGFGEKVKAIYRNKYTTAVGFDYFDFAQYKYAQATVRSRVERSRQRLAQKSKLANTEVFSALLN